MDLLVGTSGYAYDAWRDAFYPPGLPATRRLGYFAERIGTVEINNTFYQMPRADLLRRWYEETPPAFRFTLKASRRITHFAKLRRCEESVAYLCRTASLLEEKLAALLFQLPPVLKKDLPCLRDFLCCLPAGTRAVLEFRHPSWFDEEVLAELALRGVTLGWNDDMEVQTPQVATAALGYVRLRRGDYDDRELDAWVERIQRERWDAALVYFKHEDNAWAQAERFMERARRAGSLPCSRVGPISASV